MRRRMVVIISRNIAQNQSVSNKQLKYLVFVRKCYYGQQTFSFCSDTKFLPILVNNVVDALTLAEISTYTRLVEIGILLFFKDEHLTAL